jgi:hypothetical protein
MIKQSIIAFLLVAPAIGTMAQKQPQSDAVFDTKLYVQGEDGTNGSAVAYNPNLKLYYIVIAGNADYPLEVTDLAGNTKYTGPAGVDVRGMWYNAKKNRLEGNAYAGGLFAIELDMQGLPAQVVTISDGSFDGNPQACGVFDGKSAVMYYDHNLGEVDFYKAKGHKYKGHVKLTGFPTYLGGINSTSIIYTGYKGYEIGVLDYDSNEIYLFDRKTGKRSAIVKLPTEAITNSQFWFAYANDRVWLYDSDERAWSGYRIF